jgi:hypothetical protein
MAAPLVVSPDVDPYAFTNNIFDKVAIEQNQFGIVQHDYNGYVTNATAQWLTNSATQNK